MYINGQNPFLFRPTADNNTGVSTNTGATQGTNFNFTSTPIKNDSIPTPDNGVLDNIQTLNAKEAELSNNQPQTVRVEVPNDFASPKPTASNDVYLSKGWQCEYMEDGGYTLSSQDGENTIIYDKDGIEQKGVINGTKFETISNPDGSFIRKFEDKSSVKYDKSGREMSGRESDGTRFSTIYEGNKIRRIYPGGKMVVLNNNGQPTEEIDHGKNTKYSYNDNGQISNETSVGEGYSKTTAYEYYDSGQKITTNKDNSTIIQEYEYNDNGNLIRESYSKDGKEPLITEYQYNSEGKETKQTISWGTTEPQTSETKYLDNGNKITTTKWGNRSNIEEYDSNNQLIKKTEQRGDKPPITTRYKYNDNGDLVEKKRQTGKDNPRITTYEYDNKNNCTSIVTKQGKNPAISTTCEYNVINNKPELEITKEGNKEIERIEYTYHLPNETIKTKTTKTDNGTDVEEYNIEGQIINKKTTDKDGLTIDYTFEYDNEGNLIRSTNPAGGISYEQHIEANGKFDKPISQNGSGDCWLLSGLESIMMKPGGREYLESLVNFDEATGNAEVTLPGVGKTYTITYEEMEEANFLSDGDGDIRIFELAMHKMMKDNPEFKSRLSEGNGMATEGGWSIYIYDAIMPTHKTQYECETDNFNMNNFNNPKFATNAAIWSTSEEGKAIGPDNQEVTLPNGHEYAVHHKDNKYVYIQNPWDEFDPTNPEKNLLKMSIKDFNKYFDAVTSRPLNYPKEFANRPKPAREPLPSVTADLADNSVSSYVPEFNPEYPKISHVDIEE